LIWFANLTFSFSLDDPATLVPTLVALLAGSVLVLFVANIVRKVFFPLGIRAGLQEGGVMHGTKGFAKSLPEPDAGVQAFPPCFEERAAGKTWLPPSMKEPEEAEEGIESQHTTQGDTMA